MPEGYPLSTIAVCLAYHINRADPKHILGLPVIKSTYSLRIIAVLIAIYFGFVCSGSGMHGVRKKLSSNKWPIVCRKFVKLGHVERWQSPSELHNSAVLAESIQHPTRDLISESISEQQQLYNHVM
jgi:hypothetical protein